LVRTGFENVLAPPAPINLKFTLDIVEFIVYVWMPGPLKDSSIGKPCSRPQTVTVVFCEVLGAPGSVKIVDPDTNRDTSPTTALMLTRSSIVILLSIACTVDKNTVESVASRAYKLFVPTVLAPIKFPYNVFVDIELALIVLAPMELAVNELIIDVLAER
jgi:hypothetical protein